MSETQTKPTAQTVISLILPETNEIPRQGTVLAKYESADGKQSLAHLMPFSYSSLGDIAQAIEAAYQALETLKANPPQITVPTPVDVTPAASKPAKAPKTSPKKPKQRKLSLDDFPEDDEVDVLETEQEADMEIMPVASASIQSVESGLKVGDMVNLPEDAKDIDGEPVPFTTGKVVEIDLSANPPRVWLESEDGEEDVWLPLETFTSSKGSDNDCSAFEKPMGMSIPKKEGQLSLFS